tara:strand:+ start:1570 stop:1944 length:375 start_codon:yes stop_codon:yes gene_type:complete
LVLVEQHHLLHPEVMEDRAVILPLRIPVEHRLCLLEVDSVLDTTDLAAQVDLVVVEHTQLVLLPQIKDLVRQTRDMMVDMVMILVTMEWVVAAVALAVLAATLLDLDLLDLEEMARHHQSLVPQ